MRRIKSKEITRCKNQKCRQKIRCMRFMDDQEIKNNTGKIPVTFNEIDCAYFIAKRGKK
jgi:hypothetical protein